MTGSANSVRPIQFGYFGSVWDSFLIYYFKLHP